MKEHYVVLVTTAPQLEPHTLELASRLAARAHAVLLFLHVVPFRRSDGEALLYAALDATDPTHEAWLAAQRPTDPGVRYRHRCEVGDPERIVAAFVADHPVDLVVAEEPPRSLVSETLWRGLAERLIRRVDCPVVIGGPGFLRGVPPPSPPVQAPLTRTTVADLLGAMVEARVGALKDWMDHCAEAARRIAHSETVRTVVSTSGRQPDWADRRIVERLGVELGEHRQALRALDWQLTVGEHLWGSRLQPLPSPALSDFLDRLKTRPASASLPIPLDETLDRLVILAGARVEAPGATGLLLLSFDAETDFLRILGQPGPLPSFETYAFDRSGLMLSNSRFPDHLRDAGLLPEPDLQTPLRLRVAEPCEGPRDAWPLTHAAREAIGARDGSDTHGYADYRGISVVGAWRWVDEYGFGVTAEVDHGVAFRPR